MKQFMAVCLVAFGLLVLQKSINAQYTPSQPPPTFPNDISSPGFRTDPIEHLRAIPSEPVFRPKREPRIVRKGLLAPSAVDVGRQKFLLSQPKTGLMRLLPREGFDYAVYRVKKQVFVRGGGAYYSFYHLTHEYGYGSDISFERGTLSAGFAGADYGILTDLGDTGLEAIDAKDPRAGFLLSYKAARKEADARTEAKTFSFPFYVDGVRYQSRLPAKVNHTYLLRSIDYDTSDLLVAFRVVSKADDGGLTIAWKILKKFSTPQLNRSTPWKLAGW
jgi:hypothetical protein